MPDDPQEIESVGCVTCPWCLFALDNACEQDGESEAQTCPQCGKPFTYTTETTETTVTFTAQPLLR